LRGDVVLSWNLLGFDTQQEKCKESLLSMIVARMQSAIMSCRGLQENVPRATVDRLSITNIESAWI